MLPLVLLGLALTQDLSVGLAGVGYAATVPGRMTARDMVAAGGLVAGLGALTLLDYDLKRWKEGWSLPETPARAGNPVGSYYGIGAPFALYAGAYLTGWKGGRSLALVCMTSLAVGGALNLPLKYIFGRHRPLVSPGSQYVFSPFSLESDHHSLPSGHTTVAFSLASAVSGYYGKWWVALPAYSLALLTGYARLYYDRHWASDVAAGALIGTVSGVLAVRGITGKRAGLALLPGGAGVAFRF